MIGRRPLIGGLAAAFVAPPSARATTQPAATDWGVGVTVQVADRARLTSLAGHVGMAALLTEFGREGLFVLRDGPVPMEDRLEGLHVPANDRRHWARVWDGTTGYPEWFGAVADRPDAAEGNRAAIEASIGLCPVTQLRAGAYHVSDTLRIKVSNRTLRGTGQSIEPPYDGGTQIVCSNRLRDVVRIGGVDADNRPAMIQVEDLTATWSVGLIPLGEGREADTPAAFRVEHVLAPRLTRCFALDPLIGFRFNGVINARCIGFGVTRTKSFGGRSDFLRGVWVQGRPRLFAGGNASLYLMDGNVTMSGDIRTRLNHPTGIFADADFADLYILGLETSQVAFPIVLDGSGSSYSGGHGDVHIRSLVLDQIIGDGVTIRNTNALAKIHVDGGYIQIVDSGQRNKGLWFEGGGGQITVSNLQITGEDSSSTSIGIYLKDRPNVSVSDTVIVENIAFPVTVDAGCPRLSLACTINGGAMRGGQNPAVGIEDASQSALRPKITGAHGVWSAGIELVGSKHDRIGIDPTMIDPAAVNRGRKLVIDGEVVTAAGDYAGDGKRVREGAGTAISVTGIAG